MDLTEADVLTIRHAIARAADTASNALNWCTSPSPVGFGEPGEPLQMWAWPEANFTFEMACGRTVCVSVGIREGEPVQRREPRHMDDENEE